MSLVPQWIWASIPQGMKYEGFWPKQNQQMLALQTTVAALRKQSQGSVGNNRGDASVTLTMTDDPVQLFSTALTGNRTVTLPTANVTEGDTFSIIRTGLGAFQLDVGGLKTIPNSMAATVDVIYANGAWVLWRYSPL